MANIWSPDIFAKTWEFATLAHQNQYYGGRKENIQVNYINHVASVAMEVINALQASSRIYNGDFAVQCALLHDIIEDTCFEYDDIENSFGKNVANGVLALTKNSKDHSRRDQMKDSLIRIKEQPYEVWMVKLADRICNLYHPPFYWNKDKISCYLEESVVICDSLKISNEILTERLKQKIEDYKLYL